MRSLQPTAVALLSGIALLGFTSPARAQYVGAVDQRFFVEARGGVNVPTFDITDAADPGPSFGASLGYEVAPRFWIFAEGDFGFHSGADIAGIEGPDVDVFHYMGKLGYELIADELSPWSFIINAGGGAMTFDVEGVGTNTFPAINVGAKIAYALTPRFSFVLSPQGDIAFADEDDIGTTDAWIWPFTAGIRVGF